MNKILISFLFFCLLVLAFFMWKSFSKKEKKAKDIIIEELLNPCDCVSSFLLVVSEINDLKKEESNIDSFEYMKRKAALEIIKNSIDEKCLVYEGADDDLQSCPDYHNLLLEYELYEKQLK